MNNANIKHICFDLDGTIINSFLTIYKSTVKTLDKLNINATIDEKEFYTTIGLHFVDIFNQLNIPVPDFQKFIEIYKEVYFDFINESEIYPGVAELLNYLRNKNLLVSLLTTKSQGQADKIIDRFNLRQLFSMVMGRRDGIAHKPSAEPLLFICNELNVKPGQTLMVGDTELDIQCGKNAGAKTCGVSYGYRNAEQIEKEKPDFIISEAIELKSFLIN